MTPYVSPWTRLQKRVKFARGALVVALVLYVLLVPVPFLQDFGAFQNEKLDSGANRTTIATRDTSERYFIGLAISGGGSRAAVFGGAVLWELHQLGILQHVQYLSAVSGGTLPATYYALHKGDDSRWNEPKLKTAMAVNVQKHLWKYALNPLRWPRYVGTGFDRSNILAEVLDDQVFDHKKFSALGEKSPWPMLLINATNYVTGQRFVFSNPAFDNLRSDLGALPIAVAATASAALPGAFRNVTLKNFSTKGDPGVLDDFVHWEQRTGHIRDPKFKSLEHSHGSTRFMHLFDGGISDNLGVETLVHMYLRQGRIHHDGCLLILVDANVPYVKRNAGDEPDTRRWYDAALDSNALDAIDVLMQSRRRQQLEALGFDDAHWYAALYTNEPPASDLKPKKIEEIELPVFLLKEARLPRPYGAVERPPCKVWHIALNNVTYYGSYEFHEPDYELSFAGKKAPRTFGDFQHGVATLPTRFRIAEDAERNLEIAAQLLVRHKQTRDVVCRWMKELSGQSCAAAADMKTAAGAR